MLGYILKLPADCPARKAMRYFFEERTNKKFVRRRRTTIITTINQVIRRTKGKYTDLPITPLISLQKQPFRGVLVERCSENMQQIYRRTPMPKCDFNKTAKQLY